MNRISSIQAADASPAFAAGEAQWWRGATIYQIYPRSFMDSNGDGIGDLQGITQRLDYIAALGVDAIWLSPFFKSPMHDFGYDVADYCDVDPIFGTLTDFDALIARAHALGLRVMIDQVYAHTSSDHAWFAESRQNRTNAKADWFVWADAKDDGSPPSNWQSVFGGPAWTWDARRQQYYLHNFLASQPQLNVHERAVQDALLAAARFWLDRGVDGFRLDALNFAMHDPALRNNPPAPAGPKPRTRPFDFQLRQYNQSHADIPQFIGRIRALTDMYDGTFTMAEVGGDEALAEMQLYTAGENRLNSAYGFDFLYADELTPELVATALAQWPDRRGIGWPSWAFENHDAPRALSRWAEPQAHDAFARIKATLFACLRGNCIIYQGEELGLTQVAIPFEQLRDPEAIANWPLTLSRDGARTPMPWVTQSDQGGFTEGTPWLPLGSENLARAIDRQEADPGSLLHFTRRVLQLRRAEPALRNGGFELVHTDEQVLAIRRMAADCNILCLFNLTGRAAAWPRGLAAEGQILLAVNGAEQDSLPAYGALLVKER